MACGVGAAGRETMNHKPAGVGAIVGAHMEKVTYNQLGSRGAVGRGSVQCKVLRQVRVWQ